MCGMCIMTYRGVWPELLRVAKVAQTVKEEVWRSERVTCRVPHLRKKFDVQMG